MKERKDEREREWANKEKQMYEQNFKKSMANREVQEKMVREINKETESQLKRLDERLNKGIDRQQEKIKDVKTRAL